jgi:guanylate kinase
MRADYLIGVVGPCTAGKSTLVAGLSQHGYRARHIAQEHSYVPAMWQKITNPDVLIFLDVSYQVSLARRPLNWTQKEYETQQHRLRHARQHADLYLPTDTLNIPQVLQSALSFLQAQSSG